MFCAAFRRFVVWGERRVLVVWRLQLGKASNYPWISGPPYWLERIYPIESRLICAAHCFESTNMSPRSKAKAKQDKQEKEENGREKRVRESRNVKAASYKDPSDSEDEKPARRRKKLESESESMSEEEKPKKKVVKGRRGSARSRKEESDSEEASDYISEESSGDDRKKRKSGRKPARSLRGGQRTSYKDLSNSEEDSDANEDDEDEEDYDSASEKEDKKKGAEKRKRGRPPKKAKKEELSESGSEGAEDEEDEAEDGEEDDEEAEVPKEPKKKSAESSSDSGVKAKEEAEEKKDSEKKTDKKPKPDHDMSEDEEDGKSEEEDKSDAAESKKEESAPKKRGRPPKSTAEKDDKEEEEEDDEEPDPKKSKVADKPAMNKTDSDYGSINFSSEAKTKNGEPWNFKISSWNVAGLKAWLKKSGLEFLKHENPDILCLQETKCSEKKLPTEAKVDGYHAYWLSGEKEGYAGVALMSKVKPIEVKYGLGKPELDTDGRVITAEFEKFFIVNVYVPNAGQGLKTLPRRLEWDPLFRAHLKSLDEKKPVILCGDMNVAHNEIDLANPKTNTKNAGFTPQEREGLTQLLKEGFVDTFRHLYPDKTSAYSFWTYMGNARSRNTGWRLDYFITSERFVSNVCDNVMRSEVYGSDHCPITLFAHI